MGDFLELLLNQICFTLFATGINDHVFNVSSLSLESESLNSKFEVNYPQNRFSSDISKMAHIIGLFVFSFL